MLLRVNKLNVKYGSSIALTDVMLEVKAGEMFLLLVQMVQGNNFS